MLDIFSAFQRLKDRKKPTPSDSTQESTSETSTPSEKSASSGTSAADKAKAEELKAQGNKAIGSRDFNKAIDLYTEAIALDPKNAIYLSNRAAAHTSLKQYKEAAEDARAALKIDSKYAKAYSRLGLALFSLGDSSGALEAYSSGLRIEGDNASEGMKKGYETAKKKVADELDVIVPTEFDNGEDSDKEVASSDKKETDRSAGDSAGPGGFDLNTLLNNPQLAQMAKNFMSNPGALSQLMNNPQVQQMAENFKNQGSMPSMGDMLNNPMLQQMARNFFPGADGSGSGSK